MPYKELLTKDGDICPPNTWGQYITSTNTPAMVRRAFLDRHPDAGRLTKNEWKVRFYDRNGHRLSSPALFFVWKDEPEINEYGEVAP